MQIRSFILRSYSERERINKLMQEYLLDWCQEWQLPSNISLTSFQSSAHKIPTSGLKHERFSNIYLSGSNGSSSNMKDFHLFSYSEVASGNDVDACVMCGFDESNVICAQIYQECESDIAERRVPIDSLTLRILSKLFLDLLNRVDNSNFKQTLTELDDIERNCLTNGNGSLVVSICIGDFNFYLLLSDFLVDHLVGASEAKIQSGARELIPKSAYNQLCKESSVDLNVRLPVTTCKLDALKNLGVGDVLSLGCELDNPIDMYINSSKVDQRVYMGVVNDLRAIKIHTFD